MGRGRESRIGRKGIETRRRKSRGRRVCRLTLRKRRGEKTWKEGKMMKKEAENEGGKKWKKKTCEKNINRKMEEKRKMS